MLIVYFVTHSFKHIFYSLKFLKNLEFHILFNDFLSYHFIVFDKFKLIIKYVKIKILNNILLTFLFT